MPAHVQPLSSRILARLCEAESHETNLWLRDDLRIARLTVAHAARGDAVLCSPHVLATYEVLGLHPEKVWPAIQARRMALGQCDLDAPSLGAKKPPQSVKLWCSENTNAARAINSRGGDHNGSPRTSTRSMATASIAALYPNSDAPSSAKKRGFTYAQWIDIVRHSYVRTAVRRATLNALTARGPWPGEDGPASGVICVSLDGMALGDRDGDGICHRRTAQRRAKLACNLNYWRLVHKFNRWLDCPKCSATRETGLCAKCGYRGRSRNRDGSTNTKEYCRPYTFEIDLGKFLTATPPQYVRRFCARTWREHKEAAKRGEHPNVTEMPARKPAQPAPEPPPATAAPLKRPAAEHEHHRSTATIGRDARQALFNAYIALKNTGKTHDDALAEVVRQFRNRFSPDDVEFALKIVGHKNGRDVIAETPHEPKPPIRCFKCMDVGEVWNQGAGPRKLPCPECSQSSP